MNVLCPEWYLLHHGLQRGSLRNHRPLQRPQGNFCCGTWSTYCPPSSLTSAGLVPTPLSQPLMCSSFFCFLNLLSQKHNQCCLFSLLWLAALLEPAETGSYLIWRSFWLLLTESPSPQNSSATKPLPRKSNKLVSDLPVLTLTQELIHLIFLSIFLRRASERES